MKDDIMKSLVYLANELVDPFLNTFLHSHLCYSLKKEQTCNRIICLKKISLKSIYDLFQSRGVRLNENLAKHTFE